MKRGKAEPLDEVFARLLPYVQDVSSLELLPGRDPASKLIALSAYRLFQESQRLAKSTDKLLIVTVLLFFATVVLFFK